MSRWIWIAVVAATVLLIVLYGRKAWAAYVAPQGAITTTDPALQREIWKTATAYGESMPLER